jgi:hypothetical protein
MLTEKDGKIEVVEYWPAFFDKDREPFRVMVSNMEDIEKIPWLKKKTPLVFEGRYIKSDGFIVAIINHQD